ncbi:MAG: hypothetical protein ACJAZS_000542 [Alteromonas naphthalenivorans]|jgi:hypothetical protein
MKKLFILIILLVVSSAYSSEQLAVTCQLTPKKHHAVMCAMCEGRGASKIKSLLLPSGKFRFLCGTSEFKDLPVGLIEDLLSTNIHGISKRLDNADKKRAQKLYDQVVKKLDYRFEKRSLESVPRQMEKEYYTNNVKHLLSLINTEGSSKKAIYPGIIMVLEQCSKAVRDSAWAKLQSQDEVDQQAIQNTEACAFKHFKNTDALPFRVR